MYRHIIDDMQNDILWEYSSIECIHLNWGGLDVCDQAPPHLLTWHSLLSSTVSRGIQPSKWYRRVHYYLIQPRLSVCRRGEREDRILQGAWCQGLSLVPLLPLKRNHDEAGINYHLFIPSKWQCFLAGGKSGDERRTQRRTRVRKLANDGRGRKKRDTDVETEKEKD